MSLIPESGADGAQQASSSAISNINLESSLCFPKEIFYAQTFDVDAFLAHYKREFTLERLRDDLNIFLKVLEMSMCELINKDYPDFVNLSTNLVDLDKAIHDLKTPLETIKKDVDSVKGSIDQEIELVLSKLNEKLMIEKRRIVLKLLMNWQRSLKVTNEMIGSNTGDNSQKLSGDHVERIAFEFCQLKNSLSICSGDKQQDSLAQNNDINKLSQMLEKIMQDLFLNCLNAKDLDPNSPQNMDAETKQQLKHVLKSYALLSKQKIAEQLFTEYVVKPYMEQYINESYLESNIRRLNGVFEKIIEFIEKYSEFLKITSEIKSSSLSTTNSSNTDISATNEAQNNNNNQFDFIVNSIWTQVVSSVDLNLNIIFSPADADLFHQNFTITFDFLNKFETKCCVFDKEFKRRLINSQSYKYFIKKWPIQVYYQIRFQEIVSKFEEDLMSYQESSLKISDTNDHEENETFDNNQNVFYLVISDTLIKQMEYCWLESKCFLKCLLSQFWKLNMQIVSRYSNFFTSYFQNKIQTATNAPEQTNLQISASQDQQQRSRTPELGSDSTNQSGSSMFNKAKSIDDIFLSVYLLNDVTKLSQYKLPNFFDGVIAPIVRSSNAIKDISGLKEAFSCSIGTLNELQNTIIEFIVKYQSEKCVNHLKNANDIPRLYRRTNREPPKVASMYIGLAINALFEFKETYANSNKSSRQKNLINQCIRSVIDSICTRFYGISNDLLESVKKMEDSLKKLQRVRQTNKSSANLSSSAMTDDDKIRLQLHLDIVEFGNQLTEKFDGYKGGSQYDSLFKLIDNVINSQKQTGSDNTTNNPAQTNNTNNNLVNSGIVLVSEENEI